MRDLFLRILNSKPFWLAYRHLRKIWVRVAGFAVFALATVALAQYLGRLLPKEWSEMLGADAVDPVLTILASSMLAVTTFSLSISVSAFASAASSATPRATALLQEDHTTQNVLAIFLGAFLFSLVGIVALKAGYYSDQGRLVLFAATVVVIALVVIALIGWISHLTDFGRMQDTLDRVEEATTAAFARRLKVPYLGGKPQHGSPPDDLLEICGVSVGFIQHIDMEALSEAAEELETEVWVAALPGSFVHSATPLVLVRNRNLDDEARDKLRAAFTHGRNRDFAQDPAFGLIVMSEIASRALSPAVNDPGTAIDVLGRLARILEPWRAVPKATLDYPNIYVPPLTAHDFFAEAFRPIARDGAAIYEVQLRLQEVFRALSKMDSETFGETAVFWSQYALERAGNAGIGDHEMTSLRDNGPSA